MTNKRKTNPYKVFGDFLSDLVKDHVEGEVLEDKLLELEVDKENRGVETLNESIKWLTLEQPHNLLGQDKEKSL